MLSSVRSQQTSPALAVRKSLEPEVDFAGGRWASPLAAEAGSASAPLRLPSQGCADGLSWALPAKWPPLVATRHLCQNHPGAWSAVFFWVTSRTL